MFQRHNFLSFLKNVQFVLNRTPFLPRVRQPLTLMAKSGLWISPAARKLPSEQENWFQEKVLNNMPCTERHVPFVSFDFYSWYLIPNKSYKVPCPQLDDDADCAHQSSLCPGTWVLKTRLIEKKYPSFFLMPNYRKLQEDSKNVSLKIGSKVPQKLGP